MAVLTFARATTGCAGAGRWFLHSGIQSPDGGVARYFRSDTCRYALVSTEITGYAASFLCFLYNQTGSAEYLQAALLAARFLIRTAWDGKLGVFPFEHSSTSTDPHERAYFFDSGIIVRGLLSVWRATQDSEFLEVATEAGQGMLRHFRGPAAPDPILDLPSLRPRAYEPRWSASPGCYQLKSAMAWHDLYETSGDTQMLAAYQATLSLATTTEKLFLGLEPDPAKTMDRLHAYLYFLEGLLPRAAQPEHVRTVAAGIERVSGYLQDIAPSFVRSDVYAQLLRIRLFAHGLRIVDLDEHSAAREAEAVRAFQLKSVDPQIDGGFNFGARGGAMTPFVNPVSTAFCVQALTMWDQYRDGRLAVDYHAII